MSDLTLERKVEELAREVALLRQRVERLSQSASTPLPTDPLEHPVTSPESEAGEELLEWMGKSALLPRVAATCFLLVIALLLRTVTDNGLLDEQVGSVFGMAYAAVLIGLGWRQYSRSRPLAPIFTVCGAVLMYVIVIETHARFASLASLPAYLLLLVTGGATATISYRYHRALPVLIGTLGMGVAAVAIDYPTPYFPYLALVLLVGNLLGAFATRLESCSWLRWILLLLTAAMMQVWGLKISLAPRSGLDLRSLGEPWFFPVLTLFALVFYGIGLWAVARPSLGKISRFDLLLPTVNSLWVFGLATYMLRTDAAYMVLLGLLGLMLAAGLYSFAATLRRREGRSDAAVAAYLAASVVLLGVGMGAAGGGMLAVLASLALAALGLARHSHSWQLGGLRTLSYLLQTGVAFGLAIVHFDRGTEAGPQAQLLVAGVVAACGLWHFLWCRGTPPFPGGSLVARIDPDDRSAVLLLLGSLVSAFVFWRTLLFVIVNGGRPETAALFQAGQSVVIIAAAIALMVLAFVRRNRELRSVAVLVTLVAAGKVFLIDLFSIRGVPLVTSVFLFGVAVSLISLALTRWPKGSGPLGEMDGQACRQGGRAGEG